MKTTVRPNVRKVAATAMAGRAQGPRRAGPQRAIANRPGKVTREHTGEDRFVGAGDELGNEPLRGQRVSLFDFPKISEETLSNLETLKHDCFGYLFLTPSPRPIKIQKCSQHRFKMDSKRYPQIIIFAQ